MRTVSWLMSVLFDFEVTRSSLDRWVKDCAAELPDAAGMAKRLHEDSRRNARHLRAAMSVPVLEIPRQVGVRPGLATTEAVADVLIEGAG